MQSKLYVLTEDGEFKKVEGLKIDYTSITPSEQPLKGSNNKKYFDIEELSALINRTKPSIYSLVHKRKIPHIKRGKRLYFELSKIEDWLKAGEVATQDDIQMKADEYLNKNRI